MKLQIVLIILIFACFSSCVLFNTKPCPTCKAWCYAHYDFDTTVCNLPDLDYLHKKYSYEDSCIKFNCVTSHAGGTPTRFTPYSIYINLHLDTLQSFNLDSLNFLVLLDNGDTLKPICWNSGGLFIYDKGKELQIDKIISFNSKQINKSGYGLSFSYYDKKLIDAKYIIYRVKLLYSKKSVVYKYYNEFKLYQKIHCFYD